MHRFKTQMLVEPFTLKPIFHWAFISRVGAYKTIHFALGTFQIFFSQIKI